MECFTLDDLFLDLDLISRHSSDVINEWYDIHRNWRYSYLEEFLLTFYAGSFYNLDKTTQSKITGFLIKIWQHAAYCNVILIRGIFTQTLAALKLFYHTREVNDRGNIYITDVIMKTCRNVRSTKEQKEKVKIGCVCCII